MLTVIAVSLIAIFAFLATVHVYWAFGGRFAKVAAIPEVRGAPSFVPGRMATLLVACCLFACAALIGAAAGFIDAPFPANGYPVVLLRTGAGDAVARDRRLPAGGFFQDCPRQPVCVARFRRVFPVVPGDGCGCISCCLDGGCLTNDCPNLDLERSLIPASGTRLSPRVKSPSHLTIRPPRLSKPRRPRGEAEYGKQNHERPRKAAFPPMVRQSGQSQHDGAVSRALHELGPEARGTAGRQADHRHRPIGLGPVSL